MLRLSFPNARNTLELIFVSFSPVNVILANLCFANLIAAVFVKSIAVTYNGYAVAASLWEVELAFCTIHTISFR